MDIERYTSDLKTPFWRNSAKNLVYMGLQGSYLRGEATEQSDIDIMLVWEKLTPAVMSRYRAILQSLGHFDRACGFVTSREELAHWNRLEINHLCHTTKDLHGRLVTWCRPLRRRTSGILFGTASIT